MENFGLDNTLIGNTITLLAIVYYPFRQISLPLRKTANIAKRLLYSVFGITFPTPIYSHKSLSVDGIYRAVETSTRSNVDLDL